MSKIFDDKCTSGALGHPQGARGAGQKDKFSRLLKNNNNEAGEASKKSVWPKGPGPQKPGKGGCQIPPPDDCGKPSADITTLAIGEEDGGVCPGDPGLKPPTDITTLAFGEEDGGVCPGDPGLKPPTDITTLALGEEG